MQSAARASDLLASNFRRGIAQETSSVAGRTWRSICAPRAGTSRYLQIVKVPQVQPEFGIGVEVSRQPEGSIRRDPAALVHDFCEQERANREPAR
jgi:hypothetical protein